MRRHVFSEEDVSRRLLERNRLRNAVQNFVDHCPWCGGSGRGVDGDVDVGPCRYCIKLRAVLAPPSKEAHE